MKKTELVSAISSKMECSKAAAERMLADVDSVIEVVAGAVEADAKIKVGKYLTVEKKSVEARTCRNPKTGEVIQKEAGVKLAVKATEALKKFA